MKRRNASKYTHEEVESFLDRLSEVFRESAKRCYDIVDPDEMVMEGLRIVLRTSSGDEERREMLFDVPLDRMPLYINTPYLALRELAAWRLRIGR